MAPTLANTSPASRFRIEQWIPYMEREGCEFTYASFEDEDMHDVIYTKGNYLRKTQAVVRCLTRRLRLLTAVGAYDAVFLFEEASRLGPAVVERIVNWMHIPIIYDFCDPIWMPYRSPTNKYLSYLKCFGKTASICKMACHVIVGNRYLAEYVRRFNANVTIVPLTIDTAAYVPRGFVESGDSDPPVIGWIGSHSTVWHLEQFGPVLQKLIRTKRFRLKVVGAADFALPGVEVQTRPWEAANEAAVIREFDIGIMPLPDDPWVRLRTHMKVRQYMGLGVPCVASPVGVIPELVEDGMNGFLAATEEEWIEKLSRLIDDRELRRGLGAAGRKTIEARCSAEQWAPKVLEIIRGSVAGRAGQERR